MLILEAEVRFDEQNENQNALPHDVSMGNIIRPAINFGRNLLFSGTIIADKSVRTIMRGVFYKVIIEMPTIEEEAYEEVCSMIYVGAEFKIQTGSRMIGTGKIFNFIYE